MPDFLLSIATFLEGLGWGAYVLVAIVVLVETIIVMGHFIPGALAMVFVGFLCYMQVFDIQAMLIVVFFAHYAGEFINYAIGRTQGRALFTPDGKFFNTAYLEMAERYFEKRGWLSYLIGQFIGVVRPLMSVLSGVVHYSLLKFAIFIGIGSAAWTIVHVGAGYLFGASWKVGLKFLENFSLLMLVGFPVVLLSALVVRIIVRGSTKVTPWLERWTRRIKRLPRYRELTSKSPRLFDFMERRLSLNGAWGITAAMGIFASLLLLAFATLLLRNLHGDDSWRGFDLATTNLLESLRHPYADNVFAFFSRLATLPVVLGTATVSSLLCLRAGHRRSAMVVALSLLLGFLALAAWSTFYTAVRAPVLAEFPEWTKHWIFEGHAGLAVPLFGAFGYFLVTHPGPIRSSKLLGLVTVVCLILIAFSRVYLAKQLPSDILGGGLIGLSCLILAATLISHSVRKADKPTRADISTLEILFVAFCLTAVSVWKFPVVPYTPRQPAAMRTLDDDEAALSSVPRVAYGLTGRPKLLINYVVVGGVAPMAESLASAGWRVVRPTDFFTRDLQNPIGPHFLDAQPADSTLARRRGNRRLIVRLWDLPVALRDDATSVPRPLAVASIYAENGREGAFGNVAFEPDPDLDIVVQEIRPYLTQWSITTVPEFRIRGLYRYRYPFFTDGHLNVLTLSDTQTTTSGVRSDGVAE